jgi:hypothetical protein
MPFNGERTQMNSESSNSEKSTLVSSQPNQARLSPRHALPKASPSNVLNSWKEIAGYLGRGVRTVQRWEAAMQLPVHRPKGKHRSAVLALREELDMWVRRTPRLDSNDTCNALFKIACHLQTLVEGSIALAVPETLHESEKLLDAVNKIRVKLSAHSFCDQSPNRPSPSADFGKHHSSEITSHSGPQYMENMLTKAQEIEQCLREILRRSKNTVNATHAVIELHKSKRQTTSHPAMAEIA